jgi:D-alanyl-D-alanine dipeptidase
MMGALYILIIVFVFQTGYPQGGINYPEQGGRLELPISGATGWAAHTMPLRDEPKQRADILLQLTPGQGFTILAERGDWWHVRIGGPVDSDGINGVTGWVLHRGCFINLPDVIPSIVFDITNAYASVKRSVGYPIPNITGYTLYEAWSFNRRLGRYGFIVPVLYSTSLRIFEAQQAALADGNTIIIYEAFRPRAVQQSVVSNLNALMDSNSGVRRAINAPPWSLGWFISTGVSNHQRGAAIDVGLGRVTDYEIRTSGSYAYTHITAFERHAMPTPMHELSPLAAAFTRPVPSSCADAWRTAALTSAMTEGAILLQGYLTDAGFTPLASEWWHFNDLEGVRVANDIGIRGEFFISTNYSETAA